MKSRTSRTVLTVLLALAASYAGVPSQAADPVVANGALLSESIDEVSRLDAASGSGTRQSFPWATYSADFSADGSRLAFDDGGQVQVRRADGAGSVLPDGVIQGQVTSVRFDRDGSSLLIASRTVDDVWSVTRITDGQPHVLWQVHEAERLHDVTQVEVDGVTGRLAVVDAQDIWVMDADGGSPALVAPTSCTESCPDFYFGAAWTPSGQLLVLSEWFDDVSPYAAHLELGTYDPEARSLTRLRSLPDQGQWRGLLLVSPDGSQVAWNVQDDPADWTAVADLTGSGAPVRLAGEAHVAWQPCPDGVCPVFRLTPRPGRPAIGRASSGAVGGRVTMTARWGKPANAAVAGLDFWKIIIAKVNSANRVTGTNVEVVLDPDRLSKVLRGYGRGRFKFRVRVYGDMGWSTYSAWSNIVRSR